MIEVTERDAAEKAAAVKRGDLPGPARSLAEAVLRVMEQVGYVQRDRQMEFGQKYRYASEAAFIAALRPEMVRHGLVVAPVGMRLLASEAVAGQKGSQNRVQLRVTFRFTHVGSGQTLDVVTCGEGMDVGDKATNKAMTAAMKYALRQTFCVETGDDPDDTPSRDQQRAAAPKGNPGLRDELIAAVGRCLHWHDFEKLSEVILDHVHAGRLVGPDYGAVQAAGKEWAKKNPKPKPQGAK